LPNRDRRFMLSFTTVGVGLGISAQPSVSVFSNLLNQHRKSVKTDGFLWKNEVKRDNRYSVSVSPVKCWCRFRCRCQVSTVGLGSDRKPKIRSRFWLWTETGSATVLHVLSLFLSVLF
jgi:hypothetical protein